MHPTGRPLDAEFQPDTPHSTLPPTDGADMIIQDFNSFFEKLSGLDDVRWNDDSHLAADAEAATMAKAAEPKPVEPKPAPKAAEAKAPEANTAMPQAPVTPAARPAATATAPAHLTPPAPGTKAAPHRAPAPAAQAPRKSGVPLSLKLTLTALVLFAVGMGAGWMALSLPKTTDRSKLAENPLIPLDGIAKGESSAKPGTLPNPWDTPKTTAETAKATAADAGATTTKTTVAAEKAETVAPVEPKAPAAPEFSATSKPNLIAASAGTDEPDAFTQSESNGVPKAPAPQAVTVELPTTGIFATAKSEAPKGTAPKPAKAAIKATPKPTAAAKPAAAPQATPPGAPAGGATGGQYAVQVGACSSAQCVENYRKLIQPHVGSHPVEVMQQAGASGAAVQRVRVEPLTKDQAQSLKQALEQADPRLKNAYVVKLADRS